MEKKRHIGAEPRGNLTQADGLYSFPGQAEEPEERGSGITRAAAESSAHRDTLGERGAYALLETQLAPQFIESTIDEIVAARLPGQGGISDDAQIDARVSSHFKGERIVQSDRLEDRAQFVIAVRAPPQNVETQVDLRVRRNQDGFHGEVCYYGLASPGVFCWTRRRFKADIFCSTSASLSGSKSPGSTRRHSSTDFCH